LPRHSLVMAKSLLTRREALQLLSSTALALVSSRLAFAQKASTTAASIPFNPGPASFSRLTPELTEGPFYIEMERIRHDITEGRPGVPLRLRIIVVHVASGAPVPRAAVDIWHCDAQGVYSGFDNLLRLPPGGFGPPMTGDNGTPPPRPRGFPRPTPGGLGPGPMRPRKPENAQTFLRGVQITDTAGVAEIDTIVPGWYAGRTTHIHVRVHNGGLVEDGRYRKGHISHTGQIFMAERITDQIYQLPPYAKEPQRRTPLEQDDIFLEGGRQLARVAPLDRGQPQLGLVSESVLVIDPAATPRPA
jgi:protocatechuate 3,4-dioxygenase beta subunit